MTNIPADSLYLSGDDVARMLSVSVVTVARWADKGRLPWFRVGNMRRYPRDAVMAMIESGRLQPLPKPVGIHRRAKGGAISSERRARAAELREPPKSEGVEA